MVQQTARAFDEDATPTRSSPKMRNDTTGEFKINLPPDVIAEMRRTTGNARSSMQVDGFRPGIFGRLINLITGRRS
jgi:hypothetical protein